MIVEDLKKSILDSAFRSKLVVNNEKIINECTDEYMENERNRLSETGDCFLKKIKSLSFGVELYDIPDNWKWIKLGNIVYNWGQMTPKEPFSYIDISSIDNKNQKLSTEETIIMPESAPSRARKIVKREDIIYSTVRPYLHNTCIINKDFSYLPIASTGFAVMHCLDKIYNKYLFYYLISPFFDSYANSSENSVGIAYPAINDEKLYNSPVPVPPLEEQHRIVELIEAVFSKLDYIKPIEEELSTIKANFSIEMKKSILLYAIQGKLSKQNKTESINMEMIHSISNINPPFSIPDNWRWVGHNDLFDVVGGSQPPKSRFSTTLRDGYVQLYQTRDYGPNPQPIYVNKKDVSKFSEKNDIILARYGGSLGKVFWAAEGAYNVALAKVIIKYPKLINIKYLYYYYLADLYQSKVKNGNRSAQAGFSKEDLNDLAFPLPPIEEQQRIVDKIEQLLPLLNDIELLVNG